MVAHLVRRIDTCMPVAKPIEDSLEQADSLVIALKRKPRMPKLTPALKAATHRPDEVAYAHEHGIPVPEGANDNPYSIDDNLWGRAIECGHMEDPWNEPLDDAWTMTKSPESTPDTPTYVEIGFEAGKPVSIDGEQMKLSELIIKLNKIAGDNGFGRLDLVEDRLVGLKSRECYEVPAALTLLQAHKALEDLTVEGCA